jgi:hypothetical protein
MKKFFTLLMMIALVIPLFAQTTEMVTRKEFQDDRKKQNDNIEASKRGVAENRKMMTRQAAMMDSLKVVVRVTQSMIRENEDSLSAYSGKIQSLEQSVNQNKLNSRNYVIITLVIFGFLFIIAFILIFLFRSRQERKAVELKTEMEQLQASLAEVQMGIEKVRESIRITSAELSRSITDSMAQFERKHISLHDEINGKADQLQEKLDKSSQLIYDVKAETEKRFKEHDDRLAQLQKSGDAKAGELEKLVASGADKQKALTTALSEDLKNFRGLLEKEIQKVKEGLAAHRHDKP